MIFDKKNVFLKNCENIYSHIKKCSLKIFLRNFVVFPGILISSTVRDLISSILDKIPQGLQAMSLSDFYCLVLITFTLSFYYSDKILKLMIKFLNWYLGYKDGKFI